MFNSLRVFIHILGADRQQCGSDHEKSSVRHFSAGVAGHWDHFRRKTGVGQGPGEGIHLRVHYIRIGAGGEKVIGSEACSYASNTTITLLGEDTSKQCPRCVTTLKHSIILILFHRELFLWSINCTHQCKKDDLKKKILTTFADN